MTQRLLLLVLLFASPVWAAPCTRDDPSGQDNCDVFYARGTGGVIVTGPIDQTATTNAVQAVVRGAATQTPDLQQWRNAAATPLAGVTNTGGLYATSMAIPRPFGMYSTNADQLTGSTTTTYTVDFQSTDLQSMLTHPVSGDYTKVQIQDAGTYRIFVSAIADTNVNGSHVDLWLAVDGANVSGSNTRMQLSATTEIPLAVEFLYTFTVGQFFQIKYHGDQTSVALIDTPLQAANPPIPYTPAVIMVVSKVSS